MIPQDVSLFVVFHRMNEDPFSDHVKKFRLNGQSGNRQDNFFQIGMAVNVQIAFILTLLHLCCDHSDQPDQSQ